MGCSTSKSAVAVVDKDSFLAVYPSVSTSASDGGHLSAVSTPLLFSAPGLVPLDEDSMARTDSQTVSLGGVRGPSRPSLAGAENEFGRAASTRSNRKCKGIRRDLMRRNASEGARRTYHNLDSVGKPIALHASEKRFIQEVLSSHFLFAGLEDLSLIVNQMTKTEFSKDQVVFGEGQQGDSCYLVQSGSYRVYQDGEFVKELESGQTFGELSLLYNIPRTATIMCSADGLVWRLQEFGFHLGMKQLRKQHNEIIRAFLAKDALFGTLSENEKENLAGACSVQVFQPAEVIVRTGEAGQWCFINIEGNIASNLQNGERIILPPGTIIGRSGLQCMGRHVATATAVDKVTCMGIGRATFERLIGPLDDIVRRSTIKSLLLGNGGADSFASNTLPLHAPHFFRELTQAQQQTFIDCLEDRVSAPLEVVVRCGSHAEFVLIAEGEFAVLDDLDDATDALSNLQLQAKEVLVSGMKFGSEDIAGLGTASHSLVALSHGKVYATGLARLEEMFGDPLLETLRLNAIKKVLNNIFLFKNLSEDRMSTTVRSLQRRLCGAGTVLVSQGEDSSEFYLIESGAVSVLKDGRKLRSLGPWDYFGERGLLLQEHRSATCVAETDCAYLALDASMFRQIVGEFQSILEQRMYLQDLDTTLAELQLVSTVGKGSFGTVKKVHASGDPSKVYALKSINKQQVVRQHQEKATQLERDIGAMCFHPCIMQSVKTFQDEENVYFLTEFLGGGDLFSAMRNIGVLSKAQAQFYGGSVCLALEYLHCAGVMYRDLKPENVLLDCKGYAKLCDFGCCTTKAHRATTLVGTPEYMAPEMILGRPYSCAVDWWSFGVVMHELIVGPQPFGFDAEDQLQLFKDILEAPVQVPSHVIDSSARSLITGLLERLVDLRLGSSVKGAKEIKRHPYFADFQWKELLAQVLATPWRPPPRDLSLGGHTRLDADDRGGQSEIVSVASSGGFSDASWQDNWCEDF
mmetsp:Transcript_48011/g.112084  ORF Transcript_48011/g.112084 Transcript_48011/m.112084 type:complete len:973 (-) Transcript_48011:218-3136(-)